MDYTKTTDFAAKDSLPSGDPDKVIKGAEFEAEFDNIATAIASKLDGSGDQTITSGNLILSAGNGIDFSATADGGGASTTSELLDDYEEGTWTPTYEATSGSGATYNTQTGKYTKIGNIVFFECDLNVSGTGTLSGSARVAGLPYTVNSADDGWSVTIGVALGMNIAAKESVNAYLDQANDYFRLVLWDSASGVTALDVSEGGNLILTCSGMYRVA